MYALLTNPAHPTMIFAALFSMLKMKNLCSIIEDAYFNPDTCGAPRRLLAYGVLFNIFTEFALAPWEGVERGDLVGYVRFCSGRGGEG